MFHLISFIRKRQHIYRYPLCNCQGAKSFLTPIEIENLPYAAALFPYMQCVRFLADYINGDTYYKIKYPEHNLVRTKAQFKLLQSVEEHTPEMVAFINECLKK